MGYVTYSLFSCKVLNNVINVFTNSFAFFNLIIVGVGKYAQVTNNPENDGCINAVLLV